MDKSKEMIDYILVESCDERYDFNLTISTTSKEKFLKDHDYFIKSMTKEIESNGVITYRKSRRVPYCDPRNYKESDTLDTVSFMFFMLIPIELVLSGKLYIEDGIVCRNQKFGFIDEHV